YPDGTRMFSQCRHIPGCWSSVSEYAIGSNGTADISGAKINPNGADRWRYRGDKPNPYQVEHDDLFSAIRSGASYSEAVNGAHSTLTAIMGRMATYSGKPVTWDEALNSQIDLSPSQYAWDAPAPTPMVAVPGQTVAV
ncbi:MAG: dehydrogenase, partial [Planctomycetales bacterium]|nr:dehydrogenase [Planctomycetales bacterium]